MWNVIKWLIKLALSLILLMMHWSLFALFIALLFYRNWWKQRRLEQTRLSVETTEGIVYREFDLYEIDGNNADGTDRMEVYNKCYRGDELHLKYNPTPEEENRLEVWTKFGQIGLIAPFFVEQFAERFKSGEDIRGRIKKISSGANPSCTLEIEFPADNSPGDSNPNDRDGGK